ncbi:cyclic adenosine monophosphate-dependent protein kinase [Diplogelasinospora grovesii]|uniref:cAMP-dependent protein kinase regulatory subunit n=1 Tax=Diplogelasinospora grovesii TaxID=303347 RepID=A0AAN6NI65_9PEZI|nr:cyclic adenosine monophosphate-dependent protein kinase [Diplogelasinospora grovesii]
MSSSSVPHHGPFTDPFGQDPNPFASVRQTGGMQSVSEEDELTDLMSQSRSPTSITFSNSAESPSDSRLFRGTANAVESDFGSDSTADPPGRIFHPAWNPEGYPQEYNFGRRTSISAESLKPTEQAADNWSPPKYFKTPEQEERLSRAMEYPFLFRTLEGDQRIQIINAMMEKPIPAKGIKVIQQGDVPGDYFYIVEKGLFEVYINKHGKPQPGPDGLGQKVNTIKAGESFGELALLYGAPRAATVVSAEPDCMLWALDRVTFRRILLDTTFKHRRMYESFLEEVPLLANLTKYERSKIADCLQRQKFPAGYTLIAEGEVGDQFFLLISGEADAYKKGNPEPVKHYTRGDYFGELALLNNAPRAASVVSKTAVEVAVLDKQSFQRLLGSVEDIMRRTQYVNIKPEEVMADSLQTSA